MMTKAVIYGLGIVGGKYAAGLIDHSEEIGIEIRAVIDKNADWQ